MQQLTIGPVLTPRMPYEHYRLAAVWNTKTAAQQWAIANGWKARDAFGIKAGTENMPFTQWVLRDPSGMVLTEHGYRQIELARAAR